MKNFSLFQVILVLTLVIFASCKKENEDPEIPCRLRYIRAEAEGPIHKSYLFDGAKRVKQIDIYNPSTGFIDSYSTLEYGANNKVFKDSQSSGSSYTIYEYDSNDRLLKSSVFYYDPDFVLLNPTYTIYEYNAENRLIKKSVFENPDPVQSSYYFTFEYDARGNIIAQNTYDNTSITGQILSALTYEYDDKKRAGIYLSLAPTGPETISPNNITKVTLKNSDGTVDEFRSRNYIYQYNKGGYPVKETYTSFDNSVSKTVDYEYWCK